MIITSIVFAKILLENKKIKLSFKNIVVIIASIILYGIIASTISGILKTLILCFLYVLVYKCIFNTTYSKSLLLAFEHIVLIIIPDLLILLFGVYILKIDTKEFYTMYTETILSTFIVDVMFLLLTYVFKKPLRKISNIKLTNNKEIIMYLLLSLFSILVVFYTEYSNVKVLSSKELILGVIVIVSFVLILYSLVKQKMENNKLMTRYIKLLEFIKNYEKELDKQKELRHESKNQLITARSKIVDKKKEHEVIEYLNSIIADYVKGNNEKYTSFQYLPANGIKGFFYYKANEAENNGINLSINVSPKVENTFIGDLDTNDFKQLGILLGVYLDNAIEASKNSKDKKMAIEIYKTGEDIEIIISNTYEGTIDTESIGKTKYTTKGKNHGYGLMLVNRILEENKSTSALGGVIYLLKSIEYPNEYYYVNVSHDDKGLYAISFYTYIEDNRAKDTKINELKEESNTYLSTLKYNGQVFES